MYIKITLQPGIQYCLSVLCEWGCADLMKMASISLQGVEMFEEVCHRKWVLRFKKLRSGPGSLFLSLPAACLQKRRFPLQHYVSHASCHDDNGLNLCTISEPHLMISFIRNIGMVMMFLHSNRTRTKAACNLALEKWRWKQQAYKSCFYFIVGLRQPEAQGCL